MIGLRIPAVVLAAVMIASILLSGCTGDGGTSPPPASTRTVTTPGTTPPVPGTIPPSPPETTMTQFTPVMTPTWTPGTIAQGEGTILIRGDVVGLKSARGTFIDELRFTVSKAPRAEPVTFEIPNTQIVFTRYGTQIATNYLILSGDRNGNQILEEGEAFLIQVPIQPPNEIYPGQTFSMAIRTPFTQATVTAEAPPVITGTVVLATAP